MDLGFSCGKQKTLKSFTPTYVLRIILFVSLRKHSQDTEWKELPSFIPEVTPLEHGMHQQNNSSEIMVHLPFLCLLIMKGRLACLDEVGMLD